MEATESQNAAEPIAPEPFVAERPADPIVAGGWSPPLLKPGQFTPRWKTVFVGGWVAVVAAFGAVWYACRVAGIAPWWLGPETDLRPLLLRFLPFAAPAVVIVVATLGSRFSVYVGIVGAVATGAIALGDLDRYPGLAAGEATIAAAALLISVAGFGGRMRRPLANDPAPVMPLDQLRPLARPAPARPR